MLKLAGGHWNSFFFFLKRASDRIILFLRNFSNEFLLLLVIAWDFFFPLLSSIFSLPLWSKSTFCGSSVCYIWRKEKRSSVLERTLTRSLSKVVQPTIRHNTHHSHTHLAISTMEYCSGLSVALYEVDGSSSSSATIIIMTQQRASTYHYSTERPGTKRFRKTKKKKGGKKIQQQQ